MNAWNHIELLRLASICVLVAYKIIATNHPDKVVLCDSTGYHTFIVINWVSATAVMINGFNILSSLAFIG
jgi:hypothetical protein